MGIKIINTLLKFFHKIKLLGFKRTGEFAKNKFAFIFYYYLTKKRVKQKLILKSGASYFWKEVSRDLGFDESFERFWTSFCKQECINKQKSNFLETLICDYNFDKEYILFRSEKALEDYTCFGFETGEINKSLNFIKCNSWHQDANGFKFDPKIFYKDFKIKTNLGKDLGPDIRTLWEFNRFNNIFFLGAAYKIENKNIYPEKFFESISSWIDANPYLYGPNWVCPMEVGIRSVNWVLGFMFFNTIKITPNGQDLELYKKFICSLYDHMIYLERNWEVYDTRTNNHYLSDLLGYYYLLNFFENLGANNLKNKILWCKKEFLKELDKQIFPDGSSYEGSVTYHVLVAEIVYYFKILAEKNILIEQGDYLTRLQKKFESICEFASCFYLDSKDFITIGDNDSGKVVVGLPKKFLLNQKEKHETRSEVMHFNNFGVSVFKSNALNVTLRHHAYNKLQPSGHFHNDFLSIAVAINGIPIIIDPGSYVYTSSNYWRNYFRSAQVHNSFYIDGLEPIKLDNNLFGLEISAGLPCHQGDFLESSHELYKDLGLKAARKVSLDKDSSGAPTGLIINDSWEKMGDRCFENLISTWNLTLHPQIKAIRQGEHSWDLIRCDNIKLANLSSSDLELEPVPGWSSLNYGEKVQITRLVAKKPLKPGKYTWKIGL